MLFRWRRVYLSLPTLFTGEQLLFMRSRQPILTLPKVKPVALLMDWKRSSIRLKVLRRTGGTAQREDCTRTSDLLRRCRKGSRQLGACWRARSTRSPYWGWPFADFDHRYASTLNLTLLLIVIFRRPLARSLVQQTLIAGARLHNSSRSFV